jgi:hypothetical protein
MPSQGHLVIELQQHGFPSLMTVSGCNALFTNLRLSCLAYFQVDAIIFLAPISGFDQVLAEDRTVNRLVRIRNPPLVFLDPANGYH